MPLAKLFNALATTSLILLLLLSQASCVKRERKMLSARASAGQSFVTQSSASKPLININTATASELEQLPGIGARTASRIIEQRERYGRFRRAEHLLVVRGISDRRFRELRALITVE